MLEIDGDPANVSGLMDNPGTVLTAIDLGAFSTGPNGLFMWRDDAAELDNSPAAGTQGPGSTVVHTLDLHPGRVDLGYEGNAGGGPDTLSNDVVNFLLVEGFTGSVGVDLDVDGSAVCGDGVFDITPWAQVVDAISAKESIATYSPSA